MSARVQTGLSRLGDDLAGLVRGRDLGLLSHPASVTERFEHAREILPRVGARLRVLFGPEHGADGEAQDMESVPDPMGTTLPRSGPTHRSLYGDTLESLSPEASWLDGLDAVVVDLQDVGSRYYTFVWTALLMARACAARGVEVIVCDRPNPLGGEIVEGPPQLSSERSFVGLVETPARHALTLGEILAWRAKVEGLENLTLCPMRGWKRPMLFEDTGLPWVLPSPNMPTVDTARVYPGACLLEGTNLSEGRGTTRPFEVFGAPWVNSAEMVKALARDAGEGFTPRELSFRPTFQKHAGHSCHGVQVHITDRAKFRPWQTYVSVLREARRSQGFAWRTEPYEFVSDRPALDLLAGDPRVREALDQGASVPELMALGHPRLEEWSLSAESRWIYPR